MDARAQSFPQSGRIFIFGFLSAIAPLSIDIYLPALPMLRQALAADEAQTLFTLSAFFIGFAGGQLVFGPLSDRFGRKALLLVGLVVYVAASIACALAASMTTMVFLAICAGLRWLGRARCGPSDGPRPLRSRSEYP